MKKCKNAKNKKMQKCKNANILHIAYKSLFCIFDDKLIFDTFNKIEVIILIIISKVYYFHY